MVRFRAVKCSQEVGVEQSPADGQEELNLSELLIPRRAVKIIQRRWSKGGRYFLQDVNDTILKRPRYDLPPNG